MSLARAAFLELDVTSTTPVQMYGWGGVSPVRLALNPDGSIKDGLSIPLHNEVVIDWVQGQPVTLSYKLNSVLVATISISYTSGNPVNVLRS